ncbi:alpha/beta hydrolase PoxA [Marinomonas sp. THO17]
MPEGHLQGYSHYQGMDRPSIHFLHGNGFAVQTYSKFLSQLEGYNLILQDAAGHGASSSGKGFVGWNATAERFLSSLSQCIKETPGSELIGMGHSFGGCMTILMNHHSDRSPFNRMVLLDPALFPPRLIWMMRGVKLAGLKRHIPLAKQASRRRTQWESYAQVHKSFYERGTFKGWETECLEDYIDSSLLKDEKGHYQLRCPTWMEAAIFSSYPKGLWKKIAKISVPTHIVLGKDTFDYFKESYRLCAKLNPNIHLVEVDGGHCFMQQDSSAAAQVVQKILQQHV